MTSKRKVRAYCLAVASALAAAVAAVLPVPVAAQAQGADLVQTNLVSDIPGLATITDPETDKPLGCVAQPHKPFLGLEPGD